MKRLLIVPALVLIVGCGENNDNEVANKLAAKLEKQEQKIKQQELAIENNGENLNKVTKEAIEKLKVIEDTEDIQDIKPKSEELTETEKNTGKFVKNLEEENAKIKKELSDFKISSSDDNLREKFEKDRTARKLRLKEEQENRIAKRKEDKKNTEKVYENLSTSEKLKQIEEDKNNLDTRIEKIYDKDKKAEKINDVPSEDLDGIKVSEKSSVPEEALEGNEVSEKVNNPIEVVEEEIKIYEKVSAPVEVPVKKVSEMENIVSDELKDIENLEDQQQLENHKEQPDELSYHKDLYSGKKSNQELKIIEENLDKKIEKVEKLEDKINNSEDSLEDQISSTIEKN